MCGIVGILQYESQVPREIRHRALKIIFSDAMEGTEVRGADATGIYQVHEGGDWSMTKKGVKSSKWLFEEGNSKDDPVGYTDIMESWMEHPRELSALIGHCRKATIGSKGRDNDDNHPFAVQLDPEHAILGIHNGTLTNHDIIFEKLPKLLKRQGQVDSEAIFHLMFHLSEHGTKPWDAKMITQLGRRVDGAAACIAVNTRFPHQVATWRFGRPMEFFLISPLNIVVIASEKKFVDSAIRKYNFIRQLFDSELPVLESFDATLAERDFRLFDTSLDWPKGKLTYQSLNDLSERGDVKPYTGANSGMEEGWAGPVKSVTPNTGTGTGTGTGVSAGVKKSPHIPATPAAKVTKAIGPGTAKKDDDTIVTVEVEIGSKQEAQEAWVTAKSLGVCSHYDSEAEVAKNLGITLLELNNLDMVELTNRVAKSHFNLGYAVARTDTAAESTETRTKGRALIKSLEKSEEKKKKSESVIWELKQLITVLLALGDSNYLLTEQNVRISLSAFHILSQDRRQDIEKRASEILGDTNVLSVIRGLKVEYSKARKRELKLKKRKKKELQVGHGKD